MMIMPFSCSTRKSSPMRDMLWSQHLTVMKGCRYLPKAAPDLVILDIQMPGLNGIEVLRQMKMINASIPVILNSAYHDYKQDLGAWASDDYVVKSSDLTDLKAAVKRLLEQA